MPLEATITAAQAVQRPWDAAVVGAGPAGALAARELARRGASVVLIDKSRFPRWKVCGCCLNGAALAILEQAGLRELPGRLGARRLDRWRLCTRAGQAVCPLPDGVALSREAFDAALIEEAIAAGAEFLPETTARMPALSQDGPALTITSAQFRLDSTLRSRVVIAADGLAGRLLDSQSHFATTIAPRARLGAGTILESGPSFFEDGVIYMISGRGGYVGLVRLEDGRLDVAAAFDKRHTRASGEPGAAATQILRDARVPLPRDLSEAVWRGTPALTRRRASVATAGVLVVGDAAGYIEPFTGEGMAWAMQSALAVAPLAAEAVAGWSPDLAARWTRQHRLLLGRRQRSCRRLGILLRSPLLTNVAVRLLIHAPWLAAPLMRSINAPPRDGVTQGLLFK